MDFTQNHPNISEYASDTLTDSAAPASHNVSFHHPHPLFIRAEYDSTAAQNHPLDHQHHQDVYASSSTIANALHHQPMQAQPWPPYDKPVPQGQPYTPSYPSIPFPLQNDSQYSTPRLVPASNLSFRPGFQSGPSSPNGRLTLAGSLDPASGMFYRTPEHPRLRTAQACEKCRTRKAKCSGEHPTCFRCQSRSLVCEYAKEGRIRGPHKAKNRTPAEPSGYSPGSSTQGSTGMATPASRKGRGRTSSTDGSVESSERGSGGLSGDVTPPRMGLVHDKTLGHGLRRGFSSMADLQHANSLAQEAVPYEQYSLAAEGPRAGAIDPSLEHRMSYNDDYFEPVYHTSPQLQRNLMAIQVQSRLRAHQQHQRSSLTPPGVTQGQSRLEAPHYNEAHYGGTLISAIRTAHSDPRHPPPYSHPYTPTPATDFRANENTAYHSSSSDTFTTTHNERYINQHGIVTPFPTSTGGSRSPLPIFPPEPTSFVSQDASTAQRHGAIPTQPALDISLHPHQFTQSPVDIPHDHTLLTDKP